MLCPQKCLKCLPTDIHHMVVTDEVDIQQVIVTDDADVYHT